MIFPDEKEFKKLAKNGNLIPVCKEIIADLDTPVSAFLKFKKQKYSFLLESVEGGEKFARYSFIGFNPEYIFQAKQNKYELKNSNNKIIKSNKSVNPLGELKKVIQQYKPVKLNGLPSFTGGAVGYVAYNAVRYIEDIPYTKKDIYNLPDIYFLIGTKFIVFDHLKHKILIIVNSNPHKNNSYQIATEEIKEIENNLRKSFKLNKKNLNLKNNLAVSNFLKEDFLKVVKKVKKYIYAGDIVQAVPSQCFSKKTNVDSFNVYRALRTINPSPYLYYLNFPELKVVGSSPELLVRVQGNIVETCPIAGTRPRGKDETKDEKLKQDLLQDEKEKAEHIMLLDLGRNDLGKVCKYETVKVKEFMRVEKYSHVMHLVSEVQGILKKGENAFSAFWACFPAGTVSGAPKIRAMQIIEELEPQQRGLYAGAIGYFSFNGNMDMAITIRTIVFKNNTAYVQAGGGIVADSVPEKEYQESCNKAKALLKAIELAEKGLDIN